MSGTITITARIIDAEKVKTSIGAIGDVSGKTAKEVQAHSKAVVAAEKEIEAAFKTQAAEYRTQREAMRLAQMEAAQAVREVALSSKEAAKATEGHGAGIEKLHEGVNAFTSGGLKLLQGGLFGSMLAFTSAEKAAEFFFDAMKEGVEKLEAAEDAGFKLAAVFHGDKEAMEGMIDAASKVGKANPFQSTVALVNAEAMLRLHHLNREEIEKLLPVLSDMATVLGQDVTDAAGSVGMAFEGSTRGLRQYGINIDKTSSEQEIFNALMERAAQFHQSAEAKADTHAGALARLKKEIGAVKAELGEEYLPVLTMGDQIQLSFFSKLSTWAKDYKVLGAVFKETGEEFKQGFADLFHINTGTSIEKLQADLKKTMDEIRHHSPVKSALLEAGEKAGGGHDSEDPSHKEEAAAKQHAEEQKRQRQTLQDELLTINKTGADLELAQEQIRHRKEMETAKGAHQNLELEQERHYRALQGINAKYPPNAISGTNTDAAAFGRMHIGTVGNLQTSTFGGRMGLGKLSEGLGRNLGSGYQNAIDGWKASQGYVIPEAALQQVEADFTVPIANAVEKGAVAGMERAVRSLMDGDFGGLGAGLLGTMKDSAATALTDAAKMALGDAAILATVTSLAAAAGTAALIGGAAAIIDAEKKREENSRNTWMDQKASSMPANTPAFDMATGQFVKLGDSAETAAASQEWLAKATERAAKNMDIVAGKQEDAYTAIQRYMETIDPNYGFNKSQGAAQNGLEIVNVGRRQAGLPEFKSVDEMGAEITTGGGLGNDFWDSGKPFTLDAGTESDIIKSTMDFLTREAEKNRVGPGSTPDRPLYSSIVNFRDMMAFFAPGELFRAQGPGTSRGDGMKGRAVKTR